MRSFERVDSPLEPRPRSRKAFIWERPVQKNSRGISNTMHHFGVLSPNVPGHIHPMVALADALRSRGHRVTFFLIGDPPRAIRGANFEVIGLGQTIFPPEDYRQSLRKLGTISGRTGLKHTIASGVRGAEAILSDAPAAVRQAGVTVLVVDQATPAGGSVAERLGLPFVTICNALMLNTEPAVPPFFRPWLPRTEWWARARNRINHAAFERLMKPIMDQINSFRRAHVLSSLRRLAETWSQIAQISQEPAAFEFSRRELPPAFHFVGPLRLPGGYPPAPFPYEQLDGRPIFYVSMGTLQNRVPTLYRRIAESCAELDAQLVITLGGGLEPGTLADLPGRPVVVSYAPQLELLRRSTLAISHAGLNTVLDALSESVPIVAIPVTNHQPGVAARISWLGAGEMLQWDGLDERRLRMTIEKVWKDPTYRGGARRLQQAIRASGGAPRAAAIVHEALSSAEDHPRPPR